MKEHPLQKIIESTLKSSDCDGLCNDKPCGAKQPPGGGEMMHTAIQIEQEDDGDVEQDDPGDHNGDNEWATKVAKVHKQDGDSSCGGTVRSFSCQSFKNRK